MAYVESLKRKRKFLDRKIKLAIIERDKSACQLCFKKIKTQSLEISNWKRAKPLYHIDHIVPFRDGGSDDISNLRLTHVRCNIARNRKGAV